MAFGDGVKGVWGETLSYCLFSGYELRRSMGESEDIIECLEDISFLPT